MKLLDAYLALSPMWHPIAVGIVLLLVGVLVNRFAPQRRPRLRRALMLFLFYALAALLDAFLSLGSASRWTHLAHELLEAVTLVNLGAIALFDVAIPTLGLALASITIDLMMAAAYALTVFAVLTSAGVELSSVMAASTVVAAILTIGLQSTLGNVVGGIAVQVDGSPSQGEWVRLDNGREGRVLQIGWRHTELETRDGDTIVVPNTTLLTTPFTILGKRAEQSHPHRMWVNFHVDFRFGPADVCRVVAEALRAASIPNVAAAPMPDVVCLDLGREGRDTVGIYAARYWVIDLATDDPTSSAVRARVHAALRRAGIPLARPSVTYFQVPMDDDTDAARHSRRHRSAVTTLRALALFRDLTDDELDRIASEVHFAPFAAGETITRQGAVAHFLYILHRGKAEVRLTVGNEDKLVAALEAPGFFGEMGLMTGEPRQASVVATTDTVCYRLDKASLDSVVRDRPQIAAGMSAVLAERRVALESVREDLDAASQRAREATERERILKNIKGFFGLEG